jgi:enamine deaminase RidA (YjgF/YER057c/UK114 family)
LETITAARSSPPGANCATGSFCADITERPKINPRRIAYFGKNLPASTLVEVKGLVDSRMKVEIECRAYVD